MNETSSPHSAVIVLATLHHSRHTLSGPTQEEDMASVDVEWARTEWALKEWAQETRIESVLMGSVLGLSERLVVAVSPASRNIDYRSRVRDGFRHGMRDAKIC